MQLMSLFGSIASKIFGRHEAAAATPDQPGAAPAAGTASPGAGAAAPGAAMQPVDVEAVLVALAANKSEQLDWRRSIVDLMKLLDLDSSLVARKQLAQELHYSGDTNDSASMNIWLHRQVMVKLAENGGKVPEDLKA
jgi:3-oxoacyl-ACP reductase-like protein